MARIVVAGYMVRYPLGGQILAHLQYVLGLRRLGHDVFFFEEHGWPHSCYDPIRNIMSDNATYGVQVLRDLMRRYDLDNHWVYRDAQQTCYGLSARQAAQVIKQSDLLINLSGVTWFDGFAQIPQRLFVDEDPAFTQIRADGDLDFWNLLKSHQHLYSYGHNLGQPRCTIPTVHLVWQPYCQPIVLDEWWVQRNAGAKNFTTVMSWNAYGNVEYAGQVYGQKSYEFPRVIDLPRRAHQSFELGVSGEEVPTRKLVEHGWRIGDPLQISRSIDSYRDYIQRSRGEFSVAKQAYVKTWSGWFSDRSAAYLASGKPVILQDTGYSAWLPVGDGLLAFNDLEEADAAIKNVNRDYVRHCRAARRLAEDYFDARRVLGDMLERL